MAPKRRPVSGSVSLQSAQPAAKPVSPAFVLEDELDKLTYDFRPYVDAHGIIPEPSSTQIKGLQSAMRAALKPALEAMNVAADTADVSALMAALAEPSKADLKAAEAASEAIIHAISDTCSGTPTPDELRALPFRGQQAFIGWLSGVLLSPEA